MANLTGAQVNTAVGAPHANGKLDAAVDGYRDMVNDVGYPGPGLLSGDEKRQLIRNNAVDYPNKLAAPETMAALFADIEAQDDITKLEQLANRRTANPTALAVLANYVTYASEEKILSNVTSNPRANFVSDSAVIANANATANSLCTIAERTTSAAQLS